MLCDMFDGGARNLRVCTSTTPAMLSAGIRRGAGVEMPDLFDSQSLLVLIPERDLLIANEHISSR